MLAVTGGERQKSLFLAIWMLLRTPVALLCLVSFSSWIIVYLIDPIFLTRRAIEVASTPYARGLLFLSLFVLLSVLWLAVQALEERYHYAVMVIVSAVSLLVGLRTIGTQLWVAVVSVLLLATNLLPDRLFDRLPARLERLGLRTVPGVGEVFFFRRYLGEVLELLLQRRYTMAGWLSRGAPAIVLASALAASLARSPYFVEIEQALRLPSSARIVARGDFNWIELDTSKRHLFVTGHGVPRLLRYDAANMDRPPFESPVASGAPQAFAYEPHAGELYAYNSRTRELMVFDTTGLQLKRAMPVPDLAFGDSWIAVHRESNTIAIASEADSFDGKAFVVLDRTTGKVRDARDTDAGNILLEPASGRLFLSFFRRSNRLMTYDLNTLAMSADVPAPHHVDRMILFEARRELLLAAPTQSSILRFNADTLAPLGRARAMFGVRTLAIDARRKLLLCASLATGQLAILDLEDFRVRSRVYLGPWLRTIQVDADRGVAYVSSNGALYELRYDSLR